MKKTILDSGSLSKIAVGPLAGPWVEMALRPYSFSGISSALLAGPRVEIWSGLILGKVGWCRLPCESWVEIYLPLMILSPVLVAHVWAWVEMPAVYLSVAVFQVAQRVRPRVEALQLWRFQQWILSAFVWNCELKYHLLELCLIHPGRSHARAWVEMVVCETTCLWTRSRILCRLWVEREKRQWVVCWRLSAPCGLRVEETKRRLNSAVYGVSAHGGCGLKWWTG